MKDGVEKKCALCDKAFKTNGGKLNKQRYCCRSCSNLAFKANYVFLEKMQATVKMPKGIVDKIASNNNYCT